MKRKFKKEVGDILWNTPARGYDLKPSSSCIHLMTLPNTPARGYDLKPPALGELNSLPAEYPRKGV